MEGGSVGRLSPSLFIRVRSERRLKPSVNVMRMAVGEALRTEPGLGSESMASGLAFAAGGRTASAETAAAITRERVYTPNLCLAGPESGGLSPAATLGARR